MLKLCRVVDKFYVPNILRISFRGALPTVVRPCVWSRNLQSEAAQTNKGL
jgi:hypothetical protein